MFSADHWDNYEKYISPKDTLHRYFKVVIFLVQPFAIWDLLLRLRGGHRTPKSAWSGNGDLFPFLNGVALYSLQQYMEKQNSLTFQQFLCIRLVIRLKAAHVAGLFLILHQKPWDQQARTEETEKNHLRTSQAM